MSEIQAVRHGYTTDVADRINASRIELSAFRLLCAFYADKPIKKELLESKEFKSIEALYGEYRDEEIIHLLIEIATLYRLQAWKMGSAELRKKEHAKQVGDLLLEGAKDWVPLAMLEACNKIIHADRINFDVTKMRKAKYRYLEPILYIYGKKGKVNWVAMLDIMSFCEWAMTDIYPIPF